MLLLLSLLSCPAALSAARLVQQREMLQSQLERVQAAAASETTVQQQYSGSVAGFLQEQGSKTGNLQHTLEQVRPCWVGVFA